jgi:hypothetical protein
MCNTAGGLLRVFEVRSICILIVLLVGLTAECPAAASVFLGGAI